jgi:23S rRNA-intervening sequence protein
MQSKPQSYKDLDVWKNGIELAKLVYALTARSPTEEKFGLVRTWFLRERAAPAAKC